MERDPREAGVRLQQCHGAEGAKYGHLYLEPLGGTAGHTQYHGQTTESKESLRAALPLPTTGSKPGGGVGEASLMPSERSLRP